MRRVFSLVVGVCLASSAAAIPTSCSTCDSPYTRQEWREMNMPEQKAFITALNCLADPVTHPHSSSLAPTNFTAGIASINATSSRYDDFVYSHMDTNIKDHFTGLFLFWHRWYLREFEKALKNECGYTGYLPYWNWSLDTKNISAAPIFSPDITVGFGTFGTAANNFAVTDGAFAKINRAYPTNHIITRNLTNTIYAYTPFEVDKVTSSFTGDFFNFAKYMDGSSAQGMHNAAHLQFMPGDMSDPSHSPNDPIFFLHHANLDRIWAKWQIKSPANKGAYGGGTVQNLNNYTYYPLGENPALAFTSTIWTAGLATPQPTVQNVMYTEGTYLCYNYTDTDLPANSI